MKVGVIGASFAKKAMLPALAHIPEVEVVALASARLSSAQDAARSFNVGHVYDDWQAMLAAHEFDLVCMATPTDTHAPMVLAALEAGAHVLSEKPMAMNATEAKQMLDRAESLERVHMIDHELRFNPTRVKLKQLLDEGAIGEVRHVNIVNISASWGDPASRPAGDWWSLAERGGGRLGANGSHQIDLLRWWFGEVTAVNGQVATLVPGRVDPTTGEAWTATADDEVSFTLELTGCPLVSVFLSGAARHGQDNTTLIVGSEGTIKLANSDERLWVAKAGEDFVDMSVDDPNAQLEGVNPGIWNVSVVSLMRELTSAIREGRPLAQGATFEDGYKCQVVMDAIKQSSDERRWITVS
ncbi:MAG: Gfo/Idh/MocA family oxidoreductase [Deinococcota bacterium]